MLRRQEQHLPPRPSGPLPKVTSGRADAPPAARKPTSGPPRWAVWQIDARWTRIIERFRVWAPEPSAPQRAILPFLGFGVFLMTRKQLLGLKERAERTVVAPPMPGLPGMEAAAWSELAGRWRASHSGVVRRGPPEARKDTAATLCSMSQRRGLPEER